MITHRSSQADRIGALVCAALGIALTMPSPGCAGLFGAKEIPSAWNDAAVKVDGSGAEWDTDAMTEKDGLDVSAANDATDLYIYTAALDRDSAAQLSGMYKQTFTLWLDGKGGKKKAYGIKITAKRPEMKEGKPPAPPADGASSSGEEKKMPEPKAAVYEAVIVNADGEEVNSLETDGVLFKAGLNKKKRPMFEFKLPLAKVLDKTGPFVGVGFETSEIDESAMPSKPASGAGAGQGSGSGASGGTSGGPGGGMGGGPGGGMGGGPGGGMGGGRGGGPGGGSSGGMSGGPGGGSSASTPSLPDAISFWLKVKLASK